MSNNGLGDATGPTRTRTVQAESDVSAGDALAINNSASDQRYPPVDQADAGNSDLDEAVAVASADISSGNRGTAVFEGPVIANVNHGNVSKGQYLSAANDTVAGENAGELFANTSGHVRAISESGGTDTAGTSLANGEAEVYL